MRKIFLLLSFLFAFIAGTTAQVWLELGAKGMMGMTGFYNKNIVNDSRHDSQFGLGLSVGGVAAINIGEYHGLNFEVLSATHHQSMSYRNDDGVNNTINIEWQSIDAYLMYRWYRDNGAFVEAGPKITYVNEAQQSFGTNWSKVNDKYASRYTSFCRRRRRIRHYFAGADHQDGHSRRVCIDRPHIRPRANGGLSSLLYHLRYVPGDTPLPRRLLHGTHVWSWRHRQIHVWLPRNDLGHGV